MSFGGGLTLEGCSGCLEGENSGWLEVKLDSEEEVICILSISHVRTISVFLLHSLVDENLPSLTQETRSFPSSATSSRHGIFTSSFHGRQIEEAGLSIPLFQPQQGSRLLAPISSCTNMWCLSLNSLCLYWSRVSSLRIETLTVGKKSILELNALYRTVRRTRKS